MLFLLIIGLCFTLTVHSQQKCPMISKGGTAALRVMTYNIRLDTVADGQNQWPNRKANVFQLIKDRTPDLLGVQEALARQMTDLQTALPNYRHYGVGRDDGKTNGEFSAIFYRADRFDLLKSGTFWLSPTPTVVGSKGWDAAITRICSWIQIRDKRTQQVLYHFNTHYDHKGANARLQSSHLILNQIKTIAGTTTPVIFTGDLNATPNSDPYRTIITNTAFKDAYSISEFPHCGPNGTFSTFDVSNKMGDRIDYIFSSSHFRVLQHGALIDSNNGFYPSDHIPVLAEVIIKTDTSG
ncbi:hypothetical protein I4U23_011684 [Adineta vaga]|nr:hypothetical protein I4U23_011684 [Adineta vaga]